MWRCVGWRHARADPARRRHGGQASLWIDPHEARLFRGRIARRILHLVGALGAPTGSRLCRRSHRAGRCSGRVGQVAGTRRRQLACGRRSLLSGHLLRPVASAQAQVAALIRVARREAAAVWTAEPTLVVIETGSIGFAGAAEDDRQRWLTAFRRLVDGIDAPLQVVIEVEAGAEDDAPANPRPARADIDDLRARELCFAEQVRRASSSHRLTTSLVTGPKHTARIETALMEMGIAFAESVKRDDPFGKELATRVPHVRRFSRSWCIERLPGTEIEAGWLFR